MTGISKINRGNEIRTKGRSMGRERSGVTVCTSSPAADTPASATAEPNRFLRAAHFSGRVILLLAGLAVMALGIDVVVATGLGNSPISSVPYVVAAATPTLTLGTAMLLWQCVLVGIQIALLRRDFRLVDLLQLPLSVFFGLCIDGWLLLLGDALHVNGYGVSIGLLLVGIILLALGITLTVISRTVMNCGEAVVKALCTKTSIRFGTMKVLFDCTCVGLSVLASLVLLGTVVGVREGTVLCAVFTGIVVNGFTGIYDALKASVKKPVATPVIVQETLEPERL